jgi:hypothetical protein
MEVVRLLSERGSGLSQNRLLEYLMEDTGEERQAWELIKDLAGLRKIAWAVFLKTLLPIEALAGSGEQESRPMIDRWEKAYSWLTIREKTDLRAYARSIMELPLNFQDRLEQAALRLINNPSL